MTNQEIIEGNKLIAEFMGGILITNDGQPYWEHITETIPYPKTKDLKYEKSWDRLMTVVDKIQKIYETKREFGVIIEITTTHIRISMKSFNYYIDKTSDDWIPFDIKILFKVVVEFIKWYNTQK